MRIVVTGAGIIGLTTAQALLAAGHQVTVLDRAAGPASGASAQNGAQLSYAFVAPLASPGILAQIPELLLSSDSPLRLRPGLSPHIWGWCLQFLAACTTARAERTTHALLALADQSREQFSRWRAGVDPAHIDFERNGKLVIHRDPASFRSAARQLELQAGRGPVQELTTVARCLEIEPSLAAAGHAIVGGIWTPSEEVADCAKVCRVLSGQLAAHPRCTLMWNTEGVGWDGRRGTAQALRIRRSTDTRVAERIDADAFVIAGGATVAPLLRRLGLRLPVQALKGYSIELPADSLRAVPTVSVTDAAYKTVFAPLGRVDGGEDGRSDGRNAGRLRVAGFAELVGVDTRIDPQRIDQLVQAVDRVFGVRARPADVKPWAGLRPATPSGMPCIGRVRRWDNVFVNAGQGALGFTLAFGSAAMLAGEIAGRPSELGGQAWFRAGLATHQGD